MACFALGVDEDELVQCMIDSEAQVEVVKNVFKVEGTRAFLMLYQLNDPPAAGRKF